MGAAMIKLTLEAEQGADQYELTAYRTGRRLVFTCTCPDASNGRACVHRMKILVYDPQDLPRSVRKAAEEIQALLRGSKVEASIRQLVDWEAQLDQARQRIQYILVNLGADLVGGHPD